MVLFASLLSSSKGNSTYISDGKTDILIDCGESGKKIEKLLGDINVKADSIDAILITHEHTDHIKGAGVLSRKYDIPIYATKKTHLSMELGRIKPENLRVISKDTDFYIGNISVRAFSIPHDAADPVGYTFNAGGEKISVATDIGEMTEPVRNNILGSSRILLESNHDVQMLKFGSYTYELKRRILSPFGHLSNDRAAQTVLELVNSGTKHILLGHLSNDNNTPDIAFKTVENLLEASGIRVGTDMCLGVAKRSEVTII